MGTAWDDTARRRNAILLENLDVGRLTGVEIGPLANPVVHRGDGEILYVDQTDTQSLRDTYANDPGISPHNIVEIDAVWGNRSLRDCIGGRLVDYVMASHVGEHVPDLITWFSEISDVLRPDGQLRLVMPDLRFSHDALRQETRLIDLLTAWVLRARRPQVRDVLDFRLHEASRIDGGRIYAGTATATDFKPDHAFQVVVDSALAVLKNPNTYFDVHCLAASAKTFATLMRQVAEQGLLRLACARFIDTAPPLFEYYVFMTPCDDQAEVLRSWAAAAEQCQDPIAGQAAPALAPPTIAPTIAHPDVAALERQLHETAAALAAARERIVALETSRSWRLTAPLRRLRGGENGDARPAR